LNIAVFRQDENIAKMLIEKNFKVYLGEKEYNIMETKRVSELDLGFTATLRTNDGLMYASRVSWSKISLARGIDGMI